MALEEIVIDAKGQYIIDIDGFVLPITNLFCDGEECEDMDTANQGVAGIEGRWVYFDIYPDTQRIVLN